MPQPHVTIYTDGGCQPNPGPGGWAALLTFDDDEKTLSGGDIDTTNNRMELTAVCAALESLDEPHSIDLYTDSQYVKNGITDWIHGWIKKGWKGVKNPSLWQRLYHATLRHSITWHWVRGHTGVEANERVDQLASAEIRALREQLGLDTLETPDGEIQVYTTTSGHKTKRSGAWAAVIVTAEGEREISGFESKTTVNRIVLAAAIQILTTCDPGSTIDYYTDSEYLQRGMTQWLTGWMARNWKTASNKPVKNQDLWQELHHLSESRMIYWKALHDNPYTDKLAALLKEQEQES